MPTKDLSSSGQRKAQSRTKNINNQRESDSTLEGEPYGEEIASKIPAADPIATPTPNSTTTSNTAPTADTDSPAIDTDDNDDNENEEINVPEHTNADNADIDDTNDNEPVITFADLGVVDVLCDACTKMHWHAPTPIQRDVLPEAMRGRDIIGLAQTGSGKSGAFLLPILHQLVTMPERLVRGAVAAVILTPTRELALQIHAVVLALGQASMGVTSCVIVGGVDRVAQAIALGRNPHMVIATPGRLVDHLKDTKGFTLRHVRFLVLDEADRMLSLDFEQELHQILDAMPGHQQQQHQHNSTRNLVHRRQTMLFSATMTSQVQKLQRASLHDPVRLEVSTKFQTPSQLIQHYLFIPAKYKDCYLTYLINELAGQSILVFGATCQNVQRLALLLRNLGFPAVALHGQMHQTARVGALAKFSSKQRSILICTDVASRGLDLPNVDWVINFDLPGHGKEYIHRVGRTARAGQSGRAIAMVTQYDVEVYQRLESLLGCKLPAYPIAPEETVLILLERVCEAQRLATRELKESLAARKNGAGGRRRPRGNDTDDGKDDMQNQLHQESKKGYSDGGRRRGGSGGKGGALPNQRGGSGNSHGKKGGHAHHFKKQRHS